MFRQSGASNVLPGIEPGHRILKTRSYPESKTHVREGRAHAGAGWTGVALTFLTGFAGLLGVYDMSQVKTAY